jgi:hypothetical protein
MFGAGWAAGKVAKHIAKASGASDEDAKVIGRATSFIVSLITLDASGLIDLSVLGPQ